MIDSAKARELAALSHEARRQKKIAMAEQASAPEIAEIKPQVAIDDYAEKTLIRVRISLDESFEMMKGEEDANKRDRLASSIAKLAELDRQLSNRPLPGTLRPNAKPAKQRATSYPEPVPQAEIIHEAQANAGPTGNWESELF